jgi:hypothetical protein
MIPKKIHYCWFGRNPLPNSAKKCITSWKKFFPDYEIIEWNEDNYDVTKIPYIKQAYEAKKYAFVSDYARFDIIYHEGGVYFDTDVEVIRSFDDILARGAFMGCEIDGSVSKETERIHASSSTAGCVNPGLGIAAAPGLRLYKEILDYYSTQSFFNPDGTMNGETVVTKTTRILQEHGLKDVKGIQKVEEITIYSKEYFNPLNNNTGALDKTENTHSIHWYSMTWLSPMERLKTKITRPLHRVFGEDVLRRLGMK